MLKSLALASAILCAFTINVEARQRHKTTGLHPECNVTMPCVTPSASTPEQARVARGRYIARQVGIGGPVERRAVRAPKARPAVSYGAPSPSIAYTARKVAATIVSHPSGCPARAFCGCGAAVRVFGSPVRSLWLARNWFKFPRTAPAPGTVAVRRGHVFVLEEDLGGGLWRVFDANSGKGLTRIHARSLAGYVVVNPHGGAA